MIKPRTSSNLPGRPRLSPDSIRLADTDLAFSYLYTFRRIIIIVALIGAGVAWAEQLSSLFAACVCIGIGELIECSYYLGVLKYSTTLHSTPFRGGGHARPPRRIGVLIDQRCLGR